ncbi:hypothetical protein B0H34DRAFT_709397 [Crassisporium funariophilum]|nr:hypothetical protein B0H34DRAFT_709397 [Crassisporium funariophilum]
MLCTAFLFSAQLSCFRTASILFSDKDKLPCFLIVFSNRKEDLGTHCDRRLYKRTLEWSVYSPLYVSNTESTRTRTMSTSTVKPLPAEIQGAICQHLRACSSTLFQLCLVSHTFRAEAERVLYARARVSLFKIDNAKAWCTSLRNRPELAGYVEDLRLEMPPLNSPPLDCEKDLQMLRATLRSCKNLKTLYVFPKNPGNYLSDCGRPWILDKNDYQLRTFVNTYYRPKDLENFLNSQTALQHIRFPHGSLRCYQRHIARPESSSITLQGTAKALLEFSEFSFDRKIEVIKVNFDDSQLEQLETKPILKALSRFCKTLVSMEVTLPPCRAMGEFVPHVAMFPDLKFLKITDNPFTMAYPRSEHPLSGFPVLLPRLENLILCFYVKLYDKLSDEYGHGCKDAAEQIMESLPSLQYFSLHSLGKQNCEYSLTRGNQTGKVWKKKDLSNGVLSNTDVRCTWNVLAGYS